MEGSLADNSTFALAALKSASERLIGNMGLCNMLCGLARGECAYGEASITEAQILERAENICNVLRQYRCDRPGGAADPIHLIPRRAPAVRIGGVCAGNYHEAAGGFITLVVWNAMTIIPQAVHQENPDRAVTFSDCWPRIAAMLTAGPSVDFEIVRETLRIELEEATRNIQNESQSEKHEVNDRKRKEDCPVALAKDKTTTAYIFETSDTLTTKQFEVVSELFAVFPGGIMLAVLKKNLGGDPRKAMVELRKKAQWERVIAFPGKQNKVVGYRIRKSSEFNAISRNQLPIDS